jgi:hypothetical protein
LGLLTSSGLILEQSILCLPRHEASKLVCCGKSFKFFPAKYIQRVRQLYIKFWGAVVESPNDEDLWHKAILLTMVLSVKGQGSGLKSFLEKIVLLETDQWDQITFSLFLSSSPPRDFTPSWESKTKRVNVLAKAGELARALGTLLSDSAPASITPAVLQSLEEKHPSRPAAIPISSAPSESFKNGLESVSVSSMAAFSLIQKSSREIAPGVDNLRYELLKQLAGRNSSPAESEFVRIIAEVLSRFANGDLPPAVALGSSYVVLNYN